jgi:hypothetical protein
MADGRRYEVDELLVRPGTYFNPQTEVLVTVDDSSSMDNEIFAMEEFEGADWVLISDDLPIDEPRRDELLEVFQATYHDGDGRQPASLIDPDEGDDEADINAEEDPERHGSTIEQVDE